MSEGTARTSWEKLRSEGRLTQEGIKGIVILTFDHLFV